MKAEANSHAGTSASGEENAGRIPLVVGVTGHRDIRNQDRSHLRRAVKRVLDDLQGEYPSSPLVLLSSLAEGADRLVAEVALALGFELIVPLPMEVTDYLQDFATPADPDEFLSLLGKAALHFIAPEIHGLKPANLEDQTSRAWT